MKLREVLTVIEGKLISRVADPEIEVRMGCGADLMSDVLAFTHEDTLLMTGLTNPQVVRTADMAGVRAIVFVRGKLPPSETVSLADQKGIPLLASKYTLFETCGKLFMSGLPSCGLFDSSVRRWEQFFNEGK
jgi:predicted transcriptional regulator